MKKTFDKKVICPICKRPFPACFKDLQLLESGLGRFLAAVPDTVPNREVEIEVIQSGKNKDCPHCGTPLWIPIRGGPTLPFIIGDFVHVS